MQSRSRTNRATPSCRVGGSRAGRGLSLALLSLGLVAVVPGLAAGTAGRIGVAAAVNPDAVGRPAAAATRVLYVGIDMQADEKVTTRSNGRAQLLFLDGSAISIGPDSEVTLDRFVYDPDTDDGDLAVTVGRGVLRFVGGRISKRRTVRIETGTATIGIRGGIATVSVGAQGQVQASLLFGDRLTVSGDGVSQSTDLPGTAIDVPAGQPPQPPRILTGGEVTATLAAFDAGPPAGAARGSDPAGAAPSTGATASEEAARAAASDTAIAGTNAAPGPDATLVTSGLSGSVSADAPAGVVPVTPVRRQTGAPGRAARGAQGSGATQAVAVLDRVGSDAAWRDRTVADGNIAEGQARSLPGRSGGSVPVDVAISGRLLRDPAFDTVDPQSLSVQFLGANTPFLGDYGIANGRLTARTATGETFAFPYRPTGAGYAVSGATATGPFPAFSATMFVAADGSFWRVAGAAPDQRAFILFGGAATALAQVPTGGTAAFAVDGLPASLSFPGGTVPLDAGTLGAAISPFYLRYGPGIGFAQRRGGAAPPIGYQTTLVIAGQGAAQRSFMAGAVATIVEEGLPGSGRPALSGRLRGSSLQAADAAPLALRASLASVGVQDGSAIYGDTGQYMVLNPSALALDRETGAVTRQTAGLLVRQLDGALAGDDGYFVLGTQPGAPVPGDFLDRRPSRSLKGYTGGVGFAGGAARNGRAFVFVDAGTAADTPGGLQVRTDGNSSSVAASALLVAAQGGAARLLAFGDHGDAATAQPASAYIDHDRYIALESPKLPAQTSDGQAVKSQDLVLVTAASIDPAALDLGVRTCKCDYLDWGFWSGSLALLDNSEERYHMASWVAGELPGLAAIPTSGTADYAGHLIGSVLSGGASYIAAGQMASTWDFAQRSGQFQVDGFDAASYAGQLLSADGRAVGGVGRSADQTRAMALSGAFFAGGGDPVAAMGGNFTVQDRLGQSYAAGGSWALDRR